MCSSGENILHMSIHPLQNCEVKLLGTVLIQLRQWFPCLLLLLLLLRHFLFSFFLSFHLPNPKLLQTPPSTTTKTISSRNKNQTKEEEKPPEKKTLTTESFSFLLPFPSSFPSFSCHTPGRRNTNKNTHLSLSFATRRPKLHCFGEASKP
jgi:hypothetical protein